MLRADRRVKRLSATVHVKRLIVFGLKTFRFICSKDSTVLNCTSNGVLYPKHFIGVKFMLSCILAIISGLISLKSVLLVLPYYSVPVLYGPFFPAVVRLAEIRNAAQRIIHLLVKHVLYAVVIGNAGAWQATQCTYQHAAVLIRAVVL